MERGDTGLGRDAYGLPRRERDRRGYGPGSYPSDDGYPDSAEEDDAAGPGRPVDAEEDDYGQLLGAMLRGYGQPLEIPGYAEDGGEEAEVAGIYMIARSRL